MFNGLNFGMTTFSLFFLEKMSRAGWSVKFKHAKETSITTQMDREVAAGWFDTMMLDTNFKFRNFTKNVPPETESSQCSDHSSYITESS